MAGSAYRCRMPVHEALSPFEPYALWLVIAGIGVLATAILPRLLARHPFSMPIALLLLGYAVVKLPLGLSAPDPLAEGKLTEHLTELGVIVALMGAGLKIDRPLSWSKWSATTRLLCITMPVSIALCALAGWWLAAFVPATAVLLGAVIAPTDPVLASEVQVGDPSVAGSDGEAQLDDEDEVRFALTSEAGLNDGLAFPFTQMAVAMALVGTHPALWFETWILIDVLYKIVVGVVVGAVLGAGLARVILAAPAESEFARSMIGLAALAATLILYGATEWVGGYGFLATFAGALVIRRHEHRNERSHDLHMLSEKLERLFTAGILIGLGAAIAGGLLGALSWPLVGCAVLIVFVVRPVAGWCGLLGFGRTSWREKLAISFFGIRGIGSLYYLAYALNAAPFAGAEALWSLVALVIVISIFVHGVLATPAMQYLDRVRGQG
ncbi:MAG: cation:proton antiporter [Verrucomicrobiota bacterium]